MYRMCGLGIESHLLTIHLTEDAKCIKNYMIVEENVMAGKHIYSIIAIKSSPSNFIPLLISSFLMVPARGA